MTPEGIHDPGPSFHERVERLFDAAQAQPAHARAAFVRDQCEGDEAVMDEVLGLLRHAAAADGGFLESPVVGEGRVTPTDAGMFHEFPTTDGAERLTSGVAPRSGRAESSVDDNDEASLPERIGDYTILGVLGKGGMGVVYHAEQAQPKRAVAIKVMRPEQMSPDQIRRFEHEAEFLGRLQHPGIAMIHEAGVVETASGPQAFLAMELVANGTMITEYATRQNLDVTQRLELVAMVCDAIEHAHQHGIMHRDLKPANILVDQTGQPKVLDFGVARATDSDLGLTLVDSHIGPLIGTVPYMSPEQAAGDRRYIDTRSDVYALGVLMYELLVGRLPYVLEGKMIHEAVRIIREVEPTRLSSIDRMFRGDIETIMGMALEKDKTRRYASAHDLGADIRRYLHDEPIAARSPNTWYLLGKFAKRHRAVVAAIIVVILSLCVATGVSLRFALAEAEQRRIAVREREISDAVNDFLNYDLLAAVAPSAEEGRGRDVLMRDVLDAAALKIDEATRPGGRFENKPLIEAAIRATLGDTYMELGLYDRAELHFVRGLELDREHLGPTHPDTLTSLNSLAMLYLDQARYREALPLFEDALRQRRDTVGDDHPDTLASMNNLALLYDDMGRRDDAERMFIETLEVTVRVLGDEHPDSLVSMNNLATFYMSADQFDEAEPLLREAVDKSKVALGPEHPETLVSISNLGALLRGQDRYDEAAELFIETLEDCRRILGDEHPDTLTTINNLALLRVRQDALDAAETLYDEALSTRRRVLGPEHADTLTSMNNLGLVYVDQDRLDEAETLLKETLVIRQRVLGPTHPSTLSTLNNVAFVYAKQGRNDLAIERWEETLALRQETLGALHPRTLITKNNLGQIYVDVGRLDEAQQFFVELVDAYTQVFGDADPEALEAMATLGEIYVRTRRFEEAVTHLQRTVELSRGVLGERHWRVGLRLLLLAEAQMESAEFADAATLAREAHGILEENFGARDASTQDAIEMLVEIHEGWGQPEEANAWRDRLLDGPANDTEDP